MHLYLEKDHFGSYYYLLYSKNSIVLSGGYWSGIIGFVYKAYIFQYYSSVF